MKTVVIPCAGTGSRLGELTQYYNKAMVTLGPKPIISYIIEHFTKEDEIIILLGYKGDYLKQVINAIYPDWNITFREVDKFEGPGSGLGYSLSKAMDLLQKPFIFWPNDTLVDNDFSKIPYRENWVMVGSKDEDSKNYRHVLYNKAGSVTILPKDATGYLYSVPYTGICFVRDYKKFWDMFSNNRELFINDGEVAGLNNVEELRIVTAKNWIDTGNLDILKKAQEEYSSKMEEVILEKPDEAIWFVDNRVIKFHIDKKFISDRVKRFESFLCDEQKNNGIKIPRLLYHYDNVYVYQREPGVIASKNISPIEFKELLDNFFVMPREKTTDEKALEIYTDFYKNKTLSRIKKFCSQTGQADATHYINGYYCLPAEQIVKQIDWDLISKRGIFTKNYHGDFHLENILIQENGDFVMLDWRQNFGNSDIGDVYYDLAKMWHSLIVNHQMVKENLFSIKELDNDSVIIDIHRTFLDTEMEKILEDFCDTYFDKTQVQLITALVFLNIAACHTYPYSRFLFYLGKYLINKIFNEHVELFKAEEQ